MGQYLGINQNQHSLFQSANSRSHQEKKGYSSEGRFSAYKSTIRQQMVGMVIMLVVYSYFFIGIDYRNMPGMFTVQLTMFMIVSLVYGFTSFFAIFYDSNDTKLYLLLPLKAGGRSIWPSSFQLRVQF